MLSCIHVCVHVCAPSLLAALLLPFGPFLAAAPMSKCPSLSLLGVGRRTARILGTACDVYVGQSMRVCE